MPLVELRAVKFTCDDSFCSNSTPRDRVQEEAGHDDVDVLEDHHANNLEGQEEEVVFPVV